MQILVCYSKFHFDPPLKTDLTYSASIIAKTIYDVCKTFGQVTYIDPSEAHLVRGKTFDLYVGQVSQFSKIHSSINARQSVLFMASTHPRNRNRVLRAEAKRLGLPLTEMLSVDKETFNKADLILQLGSDWALEALLDAGVNRAKILNIHYGINHIPYNEKRTFAKPYGFLFLAAELGLRKGVTHVLRAFTEIDGDFRLTLAGRIQYPNYEELIREAVVKDHRIQYCGWVESGTISYQELLANHHFSVISSLEDVEPGTLKEALGSGLVPITTVERVGVDYAPIGNFSITGDNRALLKKAMDLLPEELRLLSRQARHHFDTFHSWCFFKIRLHEIFQKLLAGESEELTRPKVCLVMSIFNKEDDVIRLLRALYKFTRTYVNYDLHLVFDGSGDRSYERAKRFLAGREIDVKYYDMPNICETRGNNLALRASDGKYCVILQDDIYLFERYWLEKFVYFMETNPGIGALGGLAGVNYYPSDVRLTGPGSSNHKIERSQRIDVRFNHTLYDSVHEVDAVMVGPVMVRKSILERIGYLDEISFALLHQADMDLCFRLRENGLAIFYYPLEIVNEGATVDCYDPTKMSHWQDVAEKHIRIFYDRWDPKADKSFYGVLPKPRFNNLCDASYLNRP